jgi:prepilin-type N-terminal cleavage/methylation domain-containing protein
MMRRSAFTLIEMLAVIILLAVVAGMMAMLLRETLNIERGQAKAFDAILHDNALADQFRADVAHARSAPEDWDKYHADERTLILAMPDAGHIIYVWQDGTLLRRETNKGGAAEHFLAVGDGEATVQFLRAEGNSKLVSLRVEPVRMGKPLPGQTLEIMAALSGDWR